MYTYYFCTLFENYSKSLILHCGKASYVYIISGQKFKNAKNGPFWRVFENLKLGEKQCYQSRTKIGGKCQN